MKQKTKSLLQIGTTYSVFLLLICWSFPIGFSKHGSAFAQDYASLQKDTPFNTYQLDSIEIPIATVFHCSRSFNSFLQGDAAIQYNEGFFGDYNQWSGSYRLKKLDHRKDNSRCTNEFSCEIEDRCFPELIGKIDSVYPKEQTVLHRCYFFDDHQIGGIYEGEIAQCLEYYSKDKIYSITCSHGHRFQDLFVFTPNGEYYSVEMPPMDDFSEKTTERNHTGIFARMNIEGGNCRQN